MIEDNLAFPFATTVLGVPVTVERVQLTLRDDIVAVRHDAEGLHLHARTATPGWLGERLDVGWAIGVLHPLAR